MERGCQQNDSLADGELAPADVHPAERLAAVVPAVEEEEPRPGGAGRLREVITAINADGGPCLLHGLPVHLGRAARRRQPEQPELPAPAEPERHPSDRLVHVAGPGPVEPSRQREFHHSAEPASDLSRCFNRGVEGVSAEWQQSRRRLVEPDELVVAVDDCFLERVQGAERRVVACDQVERPPPDLAHNLPLPVGELPQSCGGMFRRNFVHLMLFSSGEPPSDIACDGADRR